LSELPVVFHVHAFCIKLFLIWNWLIVDHWLLTVSRSSFVRESRGTCFVYVTDAQRTGSLLPDRNVDSTHITPSNLSYCLHHYYLPKGQDYVNKQW
jgi:hypothetical protein